MSEKIYVNYHNTPYRLAKISQGDWIDLYCAEDTELKAGDFKYISQGVSIKIPEGYESILAPRSSTFKRWGILQANSIGILDNSFCGDDDIWMMPVYATRDVMIPAGTRICQFRIQKNQPELEFVEVESTGEANRGGWGSTGA